MTNAKRLPLILILIAFATLALSPPPQRADDIPYEWKGVERVVAIGDVHGAYEDLVSVLKSAGLVDKRLHWIGGKTHLVQMGDLVDRGPDSRKAMDLLMKLEERANDKGGQVHVLIGNHEAMNIVGVLDFVSPEEFASYRDINSWERRRHVFRVRYRKQVEEARAKGEKPPGERQARKQFEADYPLGYVEHRLAFGPEGRYGRWILRHNVAIRINGTVFSHADWNEKWARVGLAEVNRRVRAELAGDAPLDGGFTFAPDSPLQNRYFSRIPLEGGAQKAHEAEIDTVLSALGATRIVVGHTMTRGVIEPRFGGKHISIDAGMLGSYGGGQHVALEIEADGTRAIHRGGKIALPAYLDESSFLSYLQAVSAVDPANVAVQVHLIDQYRLSGKLDTARQEMAELLQVQRSIPLRYQQSVCSLYGALANPGLQPSRWVAEHCGTR